MAKLQKLEFVVFDAGNFDAWQFKTEAIIEDNGWSVIICHPFNDSEFSKERSKVDDAVFKDYNGKVSRFLIRCMPEDSEALGILMDVATDKGKGEGRASWIKLLEVYASNKRGRAVNLMQDLFLVRWTSSATEFADNFNATWRKLKKTGKAPEEWTIVAFICAQLPPSHDIIRKEIEDILDDEKQTLSVAEAFQKILEWKSEARNAGGSAYATGFNKETRSCYNCKKSGHLRSDCKGKCLHPKCEGKATHSGKDCPLRPANQRKDTARPAVNFLTGIDFSKNLAFTTFSQSKLSHSSSANQVILFVDSCAMDNYFSDLSLFDPSTFESVRPGSYAPVGGSVSGTTDIVGVGISKPLTCNLADGSQQIITFRAKYVPGLTGGINLLSCRRISFTEGNVVTGHSVTLDGNPRIHLANDTIIPLRWYSDVSVLECSYPRHTPSTSITLYDLHCRLGHLHYDATAQVALEQGLTLTDTSRPACPDCHEAKATRMRKDVKLPTAAIATTDNIVASDIQGPFPDSITGKRYKINFIHLKNKYMFVYFMVSESEALDCFKRFLLDSRGRIQCDTLRTDNGSVYTSKAFASFCLDQGIVHQFSAPYTQSQNGTSERLWRTLTEASNAMLLNAKLASSYWTFSTQYAVYLKNRFPHASLNMLSPYEMALCTKPDLRRTPRFGCKAYLLIDKSRRRKSDSRTQAGIFLGISPDSESYIILNLTTKRIVTSRHVTFDNDSISPIGLHDILTVQCDDEEEHVVEEERCLVEEENIHNDSTATTHDNDDDDNDIQESSNLEHDDSTDNDEPIANSETDDGSETDFLVQTDSDSDAEVIINRNPEMNQDELHAFVTMQPGQVSSEPNTIQQALSSNDSEMWKQGIIEELSQLIDLNTFVPNDKVPQGHRILKVKSVFKKKRNSEGVVVRYKYRITPKGFQQVHGMNFFETFAPVACIDAIRTCLAVAAAKDYDVELCDVDNAFPTSDLDEDVWMELPADLMSIPEVVQLITDKYLLNYDDVFGSKLIVKLSKSLYGLKQAGRNFNVLLDTWLKENDFIRSQTDTSLYRHKHKELWILTYVDDLLIMGLTSEVKWFKHELKQKFKIKELGPIHWYLGMEIVRDREHRTISINQSQYIRDCLKRFDMIDCTPRKSPLPSGFKVTSDIENSTPVTYPYRSLIGCLLYAAKSTRPDIAFAVGCLSRHLVNPGNEHVTAAKHVLRYLKGTIDHSIKFTGDGKLVTAWADSDWGGDLHSRKSTTGFVIRVFGGPVSYASTLQRSVALASASAEYMAACAVTERLMFITNLLTFLNVFKAPSTLPITVHSDSTSCIAIAKNPMSTKRTRHIEIKYHYVREQVQRGFIKFIKVPNPQQLADVFTKADTDGDRAELNAKVMGRSHVEEEC